MLVNPQQLRVCAEDAHDPQGVGSGCVPHPSFPPVLDRPLTGRRRPARPWQSAYGNRDKQSASPLRALEAQALKRMCAKRSMMQSEREPEQPKREDLGSANVITDFLQHVNGEDGINLNSTPPRPATAGIREEDRVEALRLEAYESAGAPLRSLLGGRGVDRLSNEVKELKMKCLRLERERNKLQEKLAERDERVKQLEDDLRRMRQDPQTLHPAVQRLRKMGLNTPALAELGERWAGYVMGRTSMAMESNNFAFRAVFATHANNTVLTEDSFKSVIRQFEPTIKSDQLTRLWFFADADGSGQLDLFEFMRMFGCNANGDMSDEYFEVVTMHMYRKFHTRGGVRRVYAAADKDQDLCLTPEEWSHFLSSTKLGVSQQDLKMTKQEMNQVFQRMNTSNTGLLSVEEFEAALECAASKCFVSEKWVRDTLKAVAVAMQVEGVGHRQVIPGSVGLKEFRDLMKRFLPPLRASQLDRLWKFVLSSLTEEGGARHQAAEHTKVDNETFMRIAFGHVLGGQQESLDNGSDVKSGNRQDNNESIVGLSSMKQPVSITGREVLEQLVMLVRQHTGEIPVEHCFECLDPFVTYDHFHTQLTLKFGLQYTGTQTKQMFSLIDADRDGKITQCEFLNMFRKVLNRICDDERSGTEPLGDQGMHMQVNRLLNRIFVMESELQQLRGLLGRSGASNLLGEVVPTVPEKQYHILAAAHAKATMALQQRRDSHHSRREAHRDALILNLSDMSPDHRLNPSDLLATPRGPSRNHSVASFTIPPAMLQSPVAPDGGAARGTVDQNVCRSNRLESDACNDRGDENSELIKNLGSELTQLITDFDYRQQALLEENHALRDELENAQQALLAAKASGRLWQGIQAIDSIQESLMSEEESSGQVITRSRASSIGSQFDQENEPQGEQVAGEEDHAISSTLQSPVGRSQTAPLRAKSGRMDLLITGAMGRASTSRPGVVLRNGSRRQSLNSQTSRHSGQLDMSPRRTLPEPVGPVRRALRQFAESTSSGLKDRLDALREHLVGTVVEDRFRVEAILFVSVKTVVARCMDCLLNEQVSVRFLCDLCMDQRKMFAYEHCIKAQLAAVPHIPDVYHFSGLFSGIVYSAMELLQGKTLAMIFEEVQTSKADGFDCGQIGGLETMEMADSLLRGIDQCHQRNIVNLSIRPDTIWISPPLSAGRVRILSWEHARVFNGQSVSPEFRVLHDKVPQEPLRIVRGNHDVEMPVADPRSAGRQASKLNGVKKDRPYPNLFIKDVGALYYMPLEQLYCTIAIREAEGIPRDRWDWAQEKTGPAAKIDGHGVYWWRKGNGLAQTAMPVPVTPLGRVFEVEVVKVMTMVRRHNSDLGFCIGLTPVPPNILGNVIEKDRDQAVHEAFLAGGDCAFYIRGERLAATPSGATLAGDALRDDADFRGDIQDHDGRTLHLDEGLRRGDKVCLLAEWSGDLVLFVNGNRVGCCPRALHPSEAVRPLYGLVDLYAHSSTDEHNVRVVSLLPEVEMINSSIGGERAVQKASEFRSVQEMVHTSIDTPLGPAVDVYACALVLLQCFRGGQEVSLPPAYELFQVAISVWSNDGCPHIQGEFYLLSAIQDLIHEKETNLADISSPRVRCVLARALKRSRFSRLSSCWEFATLLSEATGWQQMTAEFAASHVNAVDQAERRHAAEVHLAAARARAVFSKGTTKVRRSISKQSSIDDSGEAEDSEDTDDTEAKSQGGGGPSVTGLPDITVTAQLSMDHIHAVWDLRPFALGHSHLSRVVQVLTTWNRRDAIRVVEVSRFSQQVPEALQTAFVACFSDECLPPKAIKRDCDSTLAMRPQKSTFSAVRSELSWRTHGTANAGMRQGGKPVLVLEDVILPAEDLPGDRFPFKELIRHNLLWLAVQFVTNLDLEPGPEQFQEGQATRVGDNHAWVVEFANAASKSRILRHLNLRSSNLGERGGWVLAQAIKNCAHLEWLNLADNELGPKAAKAVVNAAESGKSITYLDISRNAIGDKGARDLAEPLALGGNIHEIRLSQNCIEELGGEALSESLLTNTSLTTLHLGHNRLGLESVLALFRATAATCTLRSLDLEHNSPWPPFEGNETVVQAIVDCLGCSGDAKEGVGKITCVRSLSLRHCNIRSNNVQKLFTALAHNGTLEHLNMSWNAIRQLGPLEIALMLREPRCALTELDLRDNQLGTQSALGNAFAQVFQKTPHGFPKVNTKLRVLNLGNNEITPNGMRVLAESLPALVGLEELYLYHNPEIGVQGAHAIARLLSTTHGIGMNCLHRLVVSVCGIGDTGIKAIAGALRGNERLTALDISGNSVTDASMSALADVITTNKILKMMNLSLNCIKHDGLQQLLDAALSRHQVFSEGPVDIDVSSQADPSRLDFSTINHEVMAMFTGLS